MRVDISGAGRRSPGGDRDRGRPLRVAGEGDCAEAALEAIHVSATLSVQETAGLASSRSLGKSFL